MPLLVTPEVANVPVVVPLPSCKVPKSMVVAPVNVFVPVNTKAPAPCLTNDTSVPEITPDNKPLPVWLMVSVRPLAKARLEAPFTVLPVSHTSPVVASVVVRLALRVNAPP